MSHSPIFETHIPPAVAASAEWGRGKEFVKESIPLGRQLRRLFWHVVARQLTLCCIIAINIAGWIGRRRRALNDEGCEIMLTGRFDSDNWIRAHLGPLSASPACSRLWMVSTNPVPALPKVEPIYPPKWLINFVGATQARLLVFLYAAMRNKPHVVGGFHIIPNGVGAAIAGRLAGARSMYFSVGGPTEICDGGIHSETWYFQKMETPDPVVEKRLLSIISKFDLVVTMGTKAVDFFRKKNVHTEFQVLSGGIDSQRFQPFNGKPSFDLILTGRLTEIKRIDIFLQAVKLVTDKIPKARALIVGDGKRLAELKQMACDLDIDDNVQFAGRQNNVEAWVRESKIFVLTSDSEGLSLSMMEAMMCGLPVVVSDVGDLGDLAEDNVNGFLVPRRCPEQFAARIIELLTDKKKLKAFSKAARHSALDYSIQAATDEWNHVIESTRLAEYKV
ncbi:MAG: hypothetical protein A2Z25_06120 [Planctomycetes bacterium RBG_16_55_9]|nr:MAG: hypothetical protein A2Z25_06120 [Planctomycetes bacterium RBG_16_55_9]